MDVTCNNDETITKENIIAPIINELEQVEKILQSHTKTAFPLINEINAYVHTSGGKRLRPALLLLVAKLLGSTESRLARLGAVMELIHAATLVHDDVIDNADIRRGRPSVNERWGNPRTVLMGDWMYMTAFQIALELRNFKVLDILIDVTRTMVAGEMMQLELSRKLDTSVQDHLEISLRKTAYLFSACCRLPAVVAESSPEREKTLATYGRALGMVFQLTDDMLDYSSKQETLGKPVLKDLEEGKITLPIIYLMQQATTTERRFISRISEKNQIEEDDKQKLLGLVKRYKTLEELRDLAEKYAKEACDCLLSFPDTPFRNLLSQLPGFMLDRDF